MAQTPIEHVSDTALWVATYRALETRRKDAVIHDRLADLLAGERGREIAKTMSASSRYVYWSVIMRTLVIDDLILQAIAEGFDTIVNLGAGLDTRPYRMSLPQDLHWIELDFKHVIDMKNEKLENELPNCHLKRIAVDLSQSGERQRVLREINEQSQKALVLTEGVTPYLTESMVAELARDLHQTPCVQRWVSEYYSPQLYPRFQSEEFTRRLKNAPFQFYPKSWFEFFNRVGWKQKEIRYLYDESEKVKRPFPLPLLWRLLYPLLKSKMAPKLRLQAYMVLEKIN